MFSAVIRDRLPIIEKYVRTGHILDLGCVDARTQPAGAAQRNTPRRLSTGGIIRSCPPIPFYGRQSSKIWRYGHRMVHQDHTNWQDPPTLTQLLRRTAFEAIEGYWVQPHPALLKTWTRLLRT